MNFDALLLQHEAGIRLGFFIGIFAVMALWEIFAPRRSLKLAKSARWLNNIALVVLNTLLLRLLFPAAAVGVAAFVNEHGWGILNLYQLPLAISTLLSVVALDFLIYLQHVMVHAIPLFWRLHRVHHADLDFDVTTGSRFHPLEIILSMLIKFTAIVALGPPVIAVVIFEIILNASSMFNHSNVRMPVNIDRLLRFVIVTPDMHRVHHSIEDDETNCNFGFSLPWWDRLFGTYRTQPRGGHEAMTIGIRSFRQIKDCNRLPGMLSIPFRGKISDYVINRRQWSDDA